MNIATVYIMSVLAAFPNRKNLHQVNSLNLNNTLPKTLEHTKPPIHSTLGNYGMPIPLNTNKSSRDIRPVPIFTSQKTDFNSKC